MLLPGDNYSEQLMFTLEGYRETWVDGRAATLYGETLSALDKASQLSKNDQKQLQKLKGQNDLPEALDFALDVFDVTKKGLRFSRIAAPLILADGPLPFGDAVFVVALGLHLGIAAHHLMIHAA